MANKTEQRAGFPTQKERETPLFVWEVMPHTVGIPQTDEGGIGMLIVADDVIVDTAAYAVVLDEPNNSIQATSATGRKITLAKFPELRFTLYTFQSLREAVIDGSAVYVIPSGIKNQWLFQ